MASPFDLVYRSHVFGLVRVLYNRRYPLWPEHPALPIPLITDIWLGKGDPYRYREIPVGTVHCMAIGQLSCVSLQYRS
jgi:hypothetical protein